LNSFNWLFHDVQSWNYKYTTDKGPRCILKHPAIPRSTLSGQRPWSQEADVDASTGTQALGFRMFFVGKTMGKTIISISMIIPYVHGGL